ncbi:hypothetical protein M0534_11040 [Methylonatrum kenyense]|uniref:hypothetical protein n=1 Tax=Methylonatrum kenyense TaxID=455253 RepID=UPI0020BEB701|nr:hypothetical protein [Methylonatrum kenyense]MCK8516853.1 hypothetical protein [Methylonatrum kenyense]
MAKQGAPRDQRMRQRLIQECARIMVEEGVRDYLVVKRKAADRLNAPGTENMPRNREIQEAVLDYQRLFRGDRHASHLRELREAALEAMQFFAAFRPRLVGSVLDGTASDWSDVNLHVFADTPEDVAVFLMDRGIPFETAERRLRFNRDDWEFYPVYRFMAGDVPVDLTVFSGGGLRQAPRSPVDGQPMDRANRDAVRQLLNGEPELLVPPPG